jgi:hypothetical protein
MGESKGEPASGWLIHLVGRHRRGRRAKRECIRSSKGISISSSFHAAPLAGFFFI